jgi:hypothetical protein
MTKAKRVHSTPRKTAPKIKPKLSAVSRIDKSGFDLVPTRKMTGKRATIKDCAKVNFKPWRRTADMQPTELMPSAEVVNANGVNCRARLRCDAEDARPADRYAWQPGPCAHRQVNGRALETAEWLKATAYMVEMAYLRVLVSAAAAQEKGVKFKGVHYEAARRVTASR